ncbi:Arc family DNA-binding protein [Rhizobium pusense]|uniref:Arc family DNA-binding protein n=1 Tax=Agrobacterium pusense TaxID=648995 RepID=UPI001F27A36A|nr:Arc family DNA-binding protein [Agrobacterium pusense]MDH0907582.1 Arc family DNA-binding protein [Agrobacterium pusense]MDH1093651.1 Arc family DNA-binding protein [Agrobacterium pusense]MDH1110453.1 Arc family DNA-binding protein [Agrobacterium pusense]MDH2194979.1 Arc family DNA-binding protein [Agrobacterium pusense]
MSDQKTGRGSDQFPLRLPDGMREQIKIAAERNGRSMNAEIVTRLENSLVGSQSNSSLDAIATAFVNKMIAAPHPLSENDRNKFHDSYEEAKQTEARAIRRFMDVASELLEKMQITRKKS